MHGVISLERLPREYGKNRRRIEITKIRGADYIDGYHDYAISRGGVSIFPRLEPHARCVQVQRRCYFVRSAEPRSASGRRPRPRGRGADHRSGRLRQDHSFHEIRGRGRTNGESAWMFVFDEGLRTMLARSAGLNLGLQECIDAGSLRVHQIDPAEMSPGEFAYRVRESVDQTNAKVVIIDSLNGYLTSMPQEQFLTLQLHELLTYLNQRGVVTILILGQHGPLGQQGSDVDLSYLADTIVLLRFFEAAGEIRRAISVIKKRSSGHERTIRELEIGAPEGLRIGAPLTAFRGILTGVPEFTGDVESLFASRE